MTHDTLTLLARRAAAVLLLLAVPALPVLAEDEPADEARGAVKGTVAPSKSGEPVLVFLRDVPGDYAPRVRTAELRGGALAPKVIGAAVGDTIKFVNLDGQAHAVASIEGGFELGLLDKGDVRGQVVLKAGAYPVRCAVHKELLGWIYVGPNPYLVLADKAGAYELKDVPAGKFSVATWSPGKSADAGAPVAMDAGAAVEVAAAAAAPRPAAKAAPAPAAKKAPPEPKLPDNGSIRGRVLAEPARYLDETVVYLVKVGGPYPPRKTAMDQRKMKFIPHVLPVTQGDTVRFLNNDGLAHNVYTNDGEGYNLGMFKDGEERPWTFKNTGSYAQLCNIHPDMLAYVFVGQNPYMATVDSSGHYEIRGVPPGTYTLAVWNSHLKAPEQKVTVERGGVAEIGFTLKR